MILQLFGEVGRDSLPSSGRRNGERLLSVMHISAANHFLYFALHWLVDHCRPGCRILDTGSMDINGNMKDLLERVQDHSGLNFTYVGMDMAPGKNVDVVADNPWSWPMFGDGSFDAVISSSAMEHDPLFWVTFREIARVVRPGGLVYINAPAGGFYHAHPRDCWRFYEDAWEALSLWEPSMQLLSAGVQREAAKVESFHWSDSVGVFMKLRPEDVPKGSVVERWSAKVQERPAEPGNDGIYRTESGSARWSDFMAASMPLWT